MNDFRTGLLLGLIVCAVPAVGVLLIYMLGAL